MNLGSYADGRVLAYDETSGAFSVGATPITPAQLAAYSEAGQIAWLTEDYRKWFSATFPVVPAAPAAAKAKGPRRVVAIVVLVVLALALIPILTIGGIFWSAGSDSAAYYKTVEQVVGDPSLKGQRLKVGGAVIAGSWDGGSNPMHFSLCEMDSEGEAGPTIDIVYTGATPLGFGDGVQTIVTGVLGSDGTIEADEMITKSSEP